jgi:hypothetical protein
MREVFLRDKIGGMGCKTPDGVVIKSWSWKTRQTNANGSGSARFFAELVGRRFKCREAAKNQHQNGDESVRTS